jgi:hypothetical protein
VIGVTASQSARNTLAAGIAQSYNSARFLGHLPGRRGALGPIPIGPGTLLVVDEASTMPGPDLADLIGLAEARNGKVILAGDTSQLQAVQNGGGMSLLAGRLGCVRLAEPVRFRQAWERAASLRLRDGDAGVLAEYDEHARIIGGDPEEMMDAAAAAYVALSADGTDTLLMAAEHTLRRELARRIREDLVRLGLVDPGPGAQIADGAPASRGDLIVCTRNDHAVEAGEPGRALANGDLLRIDAITPGGLLVRRALDADRETGRRRWTDRQFLYANFQDAELGYAVTDHTAQGRTVHTGLAVITGGEDRQHAYVALTRGTHDNRAYVFTQSPRRADGVPGPRAAPELARYDRLAGRPASSAPGDRDAEAKDPLAVLAEVLHRDGGQLSASQTWQRALSDADHLGVLHAIWAAETTPARERRYADLLAAALPPGHQPELSRKTQWLWRTLRAAELAGLDARQILADAAGERSLTGARHVAAVIDARSRRRTGTLIPLPSPPWAAQPTGVADPDRRAHAEQIAALMDARKQRIGEHAAVSAPAWAVDALGAVPDDPAARPKWQQRAASIGAYRELSGFQAADDPIGPEPVTSAPDLRAAWHEALAALGPADGPDVRGMADGLLMHLRDTYPIETAWAPPWVSDELRHARVGARDAHLAALRAAAEAEAARRAGELEQGARHEALAASYQAMRDAHRERETTFATAAADRTEWELATRRQRQLAVAADAELRRRHPSQPWPPLRSAEPRLPGRAPDDERAPTVDEVIEETRQQLEDLAGRHREFADRLARRQSLMVPAEDIDFEDQGPAFPLSRAPRRGAILQPPPPEIGPSELTMARLREREMDIEAGT